MAGTDEVARIGRQLQNSYHGPAWHGPPLRELVDGIDVRTATARPLARAHSIWEIVLHTAAWKRAVVRRLNGEVVDLDGEEDWPPQPEQPTKAQWDAALADLDAAHDALAQRVAQLSAADLNRPLPGRGVSAYATIHGVIQHDLYHAGQVAILKKAGA